MEDKEVRAVILAAGKGTRMKADIPKVLFKISGKPMVEYVTDACREAGIDTIYIIVGYREDMVRAELGDGYIYVRQEEQLGTGHALMQMTDILKDFKGDILVLNGDGPFITPGVLKRLIEKNRETGAAGTFLTAVLENTPPFGRIVRNRKGQAVKIVEEKDAGPEIMAIKEVNTGHYCFEADKVLSLLSVLKNDNKQNEYYLTELIDILVKKGLKVETLREDDPLIVFGINSREELEQAEILINDLKRNR
ncbi:sugar phosphate nucleotidyltransferase [candidate division KSB1 bacterium]